jgi:hypothetical protein
MSTSTIPAPKFNFLFASTSLTGITPNSSRWQALTAFLASAEGALVSRLRELPNGFIFITSIPGEDHSGAIYLYSAVRNAFFMLDWEGRDDDFTAEEFDVLVHAFSLDSALAPGSSLATRHPRHPRRFGRDKHHHGARRMRASAVTPATTTAATAAMMVA